MVMFAAESRMGGFVAEKQCQRDDEGAEKKALEADRFHKRFSLL